MAIDAATRSKTSESVLAALDTEMPENGWVEVRDLIRGIDEAIAADDGEKVSHLAAALDTFRFQHHERSPSSRPQPAVARPDKAQPPPERRRRHLAVVAALGALGVSLVTIMAFAVSYSGDEAYNDEYDAALPSALDEYDTALDTALNVPLDADGDLTITLTWNTDADLDLSVEEPDRTLINSQAQGPSGTGGVHGGDGNFECAPTRSEETVSWSSGAQPGWYEATIFGHRVALCGSGTYALTIRSGNFSTERRGLVIDGAADRILLQAVEGRGTSVPDTEQSTVPPSASARPESTGRPRSIGRLVVGLFVGGIATVLALLLAVAVRRWRAATTQTSGETSPVSVRSSPLLPAPAEVRELANHTIHRLDFGTS